MEGKFQQSRLARLGEEDQRFVELFLLEEGSLKGVGAKLEVSYPTVRKRLEDVVAKIEREVLRDGTKRK